jgi:hypothetical protein
MTKQDFPPLLPGGLHALDWAGLEGLCLHPFPGSASRPQLVSGLSALLAELRSFGLTGELWIDGSFLTEKLDPADVDLVWKPDPNCVAAYVANQGRIDQLFSGGGAKALHRCDAYMVDPSDMPMLAYWRGTFGFAHDQTTAKGIIVVAL